MGRGEASPALFGNRKKCPDFGKKGPDCVYLWVKFSIQNIVLRVSRQKNSEKFPCGASFLTECLLNALVLQVLVYSQPSHILNPVIRVLFSYIQVSCATLAYAQTWHARNPVIFRTFP